MANREPAPDALARVQRFINTLDVESGGDEIRRPEDLLDFLRKEDLIGEDVTTAGPDELDRALAVREALRDLLAANHGEQVAPASIALLNDEAERARLYVHFDASGDASLSPCAPGIDAAIGRILSTVHASMQSGAWEHLKSCQRDTCRWAFYDRSKNHSSKWCSMEVCGTREKAKAYRARHKKHH